MSELQILFQDAELVVVNKPAGELVIPGRSETSRPSLRERLEAQLGQGLWVVHRLDRDTSGALVFARTAASHRAISMAFEAGEVEKHYLALVQGRLEAPRTIDVALVPARRGRMRAARPGEVGKPSVTRVRPLELFSRSTLVEAQPLTGRTHQIRVHLLTLGHPLLVDPQYGQPASDAGILQRTPLHAMRLTLPGPVGRTFEAPLPEDFSGALVQLRSVS